jgi:hypothetical protein
MKFFCMAKVPIDLVWLFSNPAAAGLGTRIHGTTATFKALTRFCLSPPNRGGGTQAIPATQGMVVDSR